jgi:hypothetical protein
MRPCHFGPGVMELLIAVAGERHGELKNQLADNYASAGEYLLRLVEDRKPQATGPAGFDS